GRNMGMRLATSVERRRRIRRAVRHVEGRLRAEPAAQMALSELADVACISLFHFIRLYQHAVGETPQATLRRLRLQTARLRLAADPTLSVTEVAFDSGYDSSQAFTRAYRRQFGSVPSVRETRAALEESVDAAVVELPPLQMKIMDVEQSWNGAWSAYDELMGHLEVAEVPQRDQEMFGILSPNRVFDHACALENDLVKDAFQMKRTRLDGGWHACLSGQPDAVWRRLGRDASLKQARSIDRPMLMRYLNDPSYRVDTEQRIRLYVPLQRDVRPEDLALLL
ncbi:MAG: helix-turn-helix domain-containing protein, partial [Solimonas sp.]